MQNPRLASRYAKSLLDLAVEQGSLEQVYADMKWLGKVMKSNRDFVNVLRSPIIKGDTKKQILEAVTNGRISGLTVAFMNLLISKGRENVLPEIAPAFDSQYKKSKNIHTIKLTSAVPLSDAVRESIINQIKKSAGYEKIELEEKVDPSIIGGFVLQIGDKLLDASISYDLKAIAKQFDNNDFIYNIR